MQIRKNRNETIRFNETASVLRHHDITMAMLTLFVVCWLPYTKKFSDVVYRVAQKSKPPPIFQKIALKIADEIRFLRKVKV